MRFQSKINQKRKIKVAVQFLLLILIFSSCNKSDPLLKGEWNVIEVHYDGQDISGIDKSGISYVRNIMMFDGDNFFLPINRPTENRPLLKAKFKLKKIGGHSALEVVDSSDKRFNGLYNYEITLLKQYNNGANKIYRFRMYSDMVIIEAEKVVVEFF